MGDEIEVRPGVVSRDAEGKLRVFPIFSRIVSLFAEANTLDFAVPGGLIGVGTFMDPSLCRGDRLMGQVGVASRSFDFHLVGAGQSKSSTSRLHGTGGGIFFAAETAGCSHHRGE